jgi:hypothetical protein
MNASKFDSRYTTTLEHCGASSPKYVVRFCGDFIASCDTYTEAESVEVGHVAKRGYDLLTRCNDFDIDVLLLKRGKKYRVAYGADITDTKNKEEAFKVYSDCLLHSAECSGELD